MKPNTIFSSFNAFIGVDVGKETLVLCHHSSREVITIANDATAISGFMATCPHWLEGAYWVVDTTGGWERMLISQLLAQNVSVHSADGRRVKSFARSLGRLAKTDAIDAALLARYGAERHAQLVVCQLADEALYLLQNLVTRRGQLVIYAQEEKQRLSSPLPERLRILIEMNLACLTDQLEQLEHDIALCIQHDNHLRAKAALMQEMPGIGPHTAALLLAQMPELGQLDRRQIAALAGLAPYARDSGKMTGRRSTYGGRHAIKKALFLAALNAIRARTGPLKEFYTRLLEAGKAKKCALIALARKIITILNARLREKLFHQPTHFCR